MIRCLGLIFVILLSSCSSDKKTSVNLDTGNKMGEYISTEIRAELIRPDGDTLKLDVPQGKTADEVLSFFSDSVDMSGQYMNAFIVVADTGQDYFILRETMLTLSSGLEFEIDTMGRGYNSELDLIALPTDDPDEIYTGNYFPRRYNSQSLSLEYLSYYDADTHSDDKTIAIVVAITDSQEEAEILLSKLKPQFLNAYIQESEIYLGCMH